MLTTALLRLDIYSEETLMVVKYLTEGVARSRITPRRGDIIMPHDWEALACSSHYNTAVAIRDALQAGDVRDAAAGIEELIDALSRSDERAIKGYLVLLMQHVIKWKVQPERRSVSWEATIKHARAQVEELREENPRFTDAIITAWWPRLQRSAVLEVQKELNRRIPDPPALTWDDVFTMDYTLL
jgi:hypothetical protein